MAFVPKGRRFPRFTPTLIEITVEHNLQNWLEPASLQLAGLRCVTTGSVSLSSDRLGRPHFADGTFHVA